MKALRSTLAALGVCGAACGPTPGDEVSGTSGGTGTDSAATSQSGTSTATTSTVTTVASTTSATTDPSTTGGMTSCPTEVDTNLPGIDVVVSLPSCEFTLAQAQQGVLTEYELIIEEALKNVDSSSSCYEAPPGRLHMEWRIQGQGVTHCMCDVGPCPPPEPMPTDLVVGTYPASFTWSGYAWNGPSDTGEPFGDPFPPGSYEVVITAQGLWSDPQLGDQLFFVTATTDITLTP